MYFLISIIRIKVFHVDCTQIQTHIQNRSTLKAVYCPMPCAPCTRFLICFDDVIVGEHYMTYF